MNNNNPYYGYPYYGYPQQQNQAVDPQQQAAEQPYKKQNTKTHFMMGMAAGAAVAYLLTNKSFSKVLRLLVRKLGPQSVVK